MQQLDLGKNLEASSTGNSEIADDWEDLEGHNVFPPLAVSCNENHMEVFGFFFQSLLKRKLWDPETGFPSGRTGWENVGALSYLPSSVAAHTGDTPLVDIVFADEKFELHARSVSLKEWSDNDVDLNLQSTDAPLALAMPQGGLVVFARDADSGKLLVRCRSDKKSWAKDWSAVGGNDGDEVVPSIPSGIALPDGSVFLFGKSCSGKMSYKKTSSDFRNWTSWEPLEHDSDAVPAVAPTPDGSFVLALRDNDGAIHVAHFDVDSESFSWHHLDGPFGTAPGITVTPQRNIWVFASDPCNNLSQNIFNASSSKWSGWSQTQFPNHVIFPPTVIARGENVDLFVVQAKSEVRHFTFTKQ